MRKKSIRHCECGAELRVEFEAIVHFDINPKTGKINRKPSADVDPSGLGCYIYCNGKCGTRNDLLLRNGRIYPCDPFQGTR